MLKKLIFPMRTSLYLIPYWVADTIKRKGLKLSDLLDIDKIRPVLSDDDLASMLIMENFGSRIIAPVHKADNFFSNPHLDWIWNKGGTNGSPDGPKISEMVNIYRNDANYIRSMEQRLFSDEQTSHLGDTSISVDDPEDRFAVHALKDDALGIVIYHGFGRDVDDGVQFRLIRAMLKQLYVYEHYTDITGTPLYTRYLLMLSRRKPVTA